MESFSDSKESSIIDHSKTPGDKIDSTDRSEVQSNS